MSGYTGSGAGGGQPGSLMPSRRAPPVPKPPQAPQHPSSAGAGSFVPPLSQYTSGGSSAGMPGIGQGPGAGGGSYTGPLRPAGPGAAASSNAGWGGPAGMSASGSSPSSGNSGGIVRKGYVSVKEDGIRSWIWSKRWLALREQTLTFHKNETTYQAAALIFLKDITNVTRTDLKPYCVEIETKDKTYYLQLKSDEELYGW